MGIKIKNLSKSFGENRIFDGFNLELGDTGIYALVGESGIGKTTLLRLICGLDRDYSGEIKSDGEIAVAFQEYRLFPTLSALYNVHIENFDKKSDESLTLCRDMLGKMGFSDEQMNLMPSELSGGMKQRVSLARALVSRRPILLLDEPTKELDRDRAKEILRIIKAEAEGRLVLMVTHNRDDLDMLNPTVVRI